jgi:hypothetical protein
MDKSRANKFCMVEPKYLLVVSTDLALCHPSGDYNFGGTPRVLESLFPPCTTYVKDKKRFEPVPGIESQPVACLMC